MIDFGTSSCTYILDFIDLKQLMACIRSISQMLTAVLLASRKNCLFAKAHVQSRIMSKQYISKSGIVRGIQKLLSHPHISGSKISSSIPCHALLYHSLRTY